MKNLIKKILKEESGNKVVKNYVTKMWARQQFSGKIPTLNYNELDKRNLTKNLDQIKKWYLDFVGGEEEAFQLFKKSIEGNIITEDDIRKKCGIQIHPQDHYKVKITKIYNSDYRGNRIVGSNEELEFGFDLLEGEFITADHGVLSVEELYDEQYDNIWSDITYNLRYELEDYVKFTAEGDFGLDFSDVTSHWDD